MRWYFEWHDIWNRDIDAAMDVVAVRWGLPIDDDDDDDSDDDDDDGGGGGDDDDEAAGRGDTGGKDDHDDDGDPWASSEQTLAMFTVPHGVAALHGARGEPEEGDAFTVSFNLVAEPSEGAVMTFDTGHEGNDVDNAACWPFAQRLGDDFAEALGGRIDEAEFLARFRRDDDDDA